MNYPLGFRPQKVDSYPQIPRTAIGEMVAATKGMGFRLNWARRIRHRGGENGKEK